MNSSKLWHSFALICTYLLFTALIANIGSLCFQNVEAHWGILLGIGIVFWGLSLIFVAQGEKHKLFLIFALIANVIGAGSAIAAYIVGMAIEITILALFALAIMIAFLYLFLMLLLTVPNLKYAIWYVVICYIVWMTGSVLLGVFVFPHIFEALHLPLPAEFGMFLLFFFLLLGFLALGTMFPVEEFFDLIRNTILPALAATFLIIIIVLLCLAGCDDCDCGDSCGDCCGCDGGDCSSGKYNSTGYGKKSPSSQTMSSMSNP